MAASPSVKGVLRHFETASLSGHGSRFQAHFNQTSSGPSIKCFVLLLGTSGGADSTCHLQYTEIMFGYKIQYLHNNIWPASAGTFIIFPPVLILTK